jgi:hypothetical protein
MPDSPRNLYAIVCSRVDESVGGEQAVKRQALEGVVGVVGGNAGVEW